MDSGHRATKSMIVSMDGGRRAAKSMLAFMDGGHRAAKSMVAPMDGGRRAAKSMVSSMDSSRWAAKSTVVSLHDCRTTKLVTLRKRYDDLSMCLIYHAWQPDWLDLTQSEPPSPCCRFTWQHWLTTELAWDSLLPHYRILSSTDWPESCSSPILKYLVAFADQRASSYCRVFGNSHWSESCSPKVEYLVALKDQIVIPLQ